MDASHWPPFGLILRTPRLELRAVTDADMPAFVETARDIHGDEPFPFQSTWSHLEDPEFTEGFLKFHWRTRVESTPDNWHIPFGVWVDGEAAGLQSVSGKDFAKQRVVDTGSWLGRRFQRRGFGTEMRAAVLHLAFDGLGALEAHSGARLSNVGSLGVSRRLGYELNGLRRTSFGDDIDVEQMLRLTVEDWRSTRRDDITIDGLDGCRRFFGIDG